MDHWIIAHGPEAARRWTRGTFGADCNGWRYSAAQSAVAAPSRMAQNAAQLGRREASNGSLDQCAWAKSRAALSAALLCMIAHGPEAARCWEWHFGALQRRYRAAQSAIAGQSQTGWPGNGQCGVSAPGGEEMNALLLNGELALVGALVLDAVFKFLAQLSLGDAEAAKLERELLGLEERGDLNGQEAIRWRRGGEVDAQRGGRELYRRGFSAARGLRERRPKRADDGAEQPQRERGQRAPRRRVRRGGSESG